MNGVESSTGQRAAVNHWVDGHVKEHFLRFSSRMSAVQVYQRSFPHSRALCSVSKREGPVQSIGGGTDFTTSEQ